MCKPTGGFLTILGKFWENLGGTHNKQKHKEGNNQEERRLQEASLAKLTADETLVEQADTSPTPAEDFEDNIEESLPTASSPAASKQAPRPK